MGLECETCLFFYDSMCLAQDVLVETISDSECDGYSPVTDIEESSDEN